MRHFTSIAALAAVATAQKVVFGANTLPANVISKNEIHISNIGGYDKEDLGNKAINAPIDDKCPTYIGVQFFSDGRFDAQRCVNACEETTRYNAEFLKGRAVCRMVNTYILERNGKYEAQACAMYTRYWDASYATNTGYTTSTADGQCATDRYTISNSVTYTNSKDRGGPGSCIGGGNQPNPSSTTTRGETSVTTTTSTGPAGTGLCAGGKAPDRTHTTGNGDVYGICLNTDFFGGDLSSVGGIRSPEELAEACAKEVGCVAASVARGPQVGYLKKERTGAVQNTGVDSVYKIKGGDRPNTTTTPGKTTTAITTGRTTASSTPMTTLGTSTTKKSEPTTTSSYKPEGTAPACFKVRAGDRIEKRTLNQSAKWKYLFNGKLTNLKYPVADLMVFEDKSQAGIYTLDNSGFLRSTLTGAIATRHSKIDNSQVFLDPAGKYSSRDPLKCAVNKIDNHWVLQCQNNWADKDFSLSGKYWFLGDDKKHLEPLSLYVEEEQCPPYKKW